MTGATGYIAGHVIKVFLDNGCSVIGTIRNCTAERIETLKSFYPPAQQQYLSFVAGDLLDNQDIWNKLIQNALPLESVIHTASPFPSTNPKHAADVI